ncbi:hypothetical protein [Staphylococcus ureilyticus]|uniref:hypothetical protein n=1 Tax=Staphylococcus ureilyticus TaxID=94138 RepID=UPI00227B4419|nr:hypothetical protein [Staphylococcus ureilyticus]
MIGSTVLLITLSILIVIISILICLIFIDFINGEYLVGALYIATTVFVIGTSTGGLLITLGI